MSPSAFPAARIKASVKRHPTLPGVASRLRSEKRSYRAHTAAFGVARGTFLFAVSRVLKSAGAGDRVTVTLPGTDIPLTLRPHYSDSDIGIFADIFVKLEYEWTFNAAPRVIVDAGGFTGLSAAYFANRYPQATIIAIEPDTENFELLKLNTARFPNVHAVQAAVWWESGTVSLTDPGHGAVGFQVADPDATVTSVGGADRARGLTRAVTIDEIIKEFKLESIDLLKMDVEGSEKEIFATCGPWISLVDSICIELHDRFKSGCSRSFFKAVDEFPIELRRNEDVLVSRADSLLAPTLRS